MPAADLAEHLAACPACAAWAENHAAVTRLWEATRPIEPSPAAWDDVWAGVTARLDAQPQDVISFTSNSRRPFRGPAVRAAQAAAVVAALVLGWVQFGRPTPGDREAPTVAAHSPVHGEVEIATGEVVMLRDDGHGLQPVVLASDDRPGVDPNFQMFNDLEAMAE